MKFLSLVSSAKFSRFVYRDMTNLSPEDLEVMEGLNDSSELDLLNKKLEQEKRKEKHESSLEVAGASRVEQIHLREDVVERRLADKGFDVERLVLGRAVELEQVWGNETLLSEQIDHFEKWKDRAEKYKGWLSESEQSDWRVRLDEAIDSVYQQDEAGVLRKKNYFDVVSDSWAGEGIWDKLKSVSRATYRYLFLRQNEVELYESFRQKELEFSEKISSTVETAEEKVAQGEEIYESVKTNPATVAAVSELSKVSKRGMVDIFNQAKKLSPRELAEKIKTQSVGTVRKLLSSPEKQKYVMELAERGELKKYFPGLEIKTKPGMARRTGRLMAVEVLTRGIMEGFESGGGFFESVSQAGETIADTDTLVEMIPLVGSKHAFERLVSDNGDPTWLKAVDLGINVVGDGFLAAGVLFSVPTFGLSAAGGLGVRAALVGTGQQMLKFMAKLGTKEGAKEIGKQTAKKGVETLKSSGKLTKELTVQTGKWAVYNQLLEEALTRVFPEGKIAEITETTIRGQLSEQQNRLLDVMRG